MVHENKIILVKPTIALKSQALAYRKEHFDYGEKVINGSFTVEKEPADIYRVKL